MKPYGNNRRDNISCKLGCCHGKRVRGHRRVRLGLRVVYGDGYSPCDSIRRASKRRARTEGKAVIKEESQ